MKNANPLSSFFWILSKLTLALALPLLAAGCGGKGDTGTKQIKPASEYFTIKVGDQMVRMQLAVQQRGDESELMRGLMWRRDLAEDQGMIFVYFRPMRMSYYMHNTPTPLDIGYFTSDGVLREYYPMFPFDETPIPSARSDIQFALEMNQGWYDRHQVKIGAQVDLVALRDALKARGFDPIEYGLEKRD